MKKIPAVFFLLILFALSISSQSVYQVETHNLQIFGETNISNWSSKAGLVKGYCKVSAAEDRKEFHEIKFTIDADSFKSPQGKVYDKSISSALKATEHPAISFASDQIKVLTANNNSYQVSALGDLTIGGVSKKTELKINFKTLPDHKIESTGSKKIKLSDFDMKAPKAILGLVKTANEVLIKFDFIFAD